MSHTAPEAAPAAAPPEELIAAAQVALAERLVHYGFNLAPAALRQLAIDAVSAARQAALERMHGSRHG